MKETLKRELRLIYSPKEQSQNGTRITCLDMARGIAIFLVVMGHTDFISRGCNIWLSSFHLPAFFFLSGILMQRKEEDKRPFAKTLLHKAKGIMVPYLWFSLGSMGLDLVQVLRGKFAWSVLGEHVIQTVSLQGYSVLWFLPVLFLAEMILLLIYKMFARVGCHEIHTSAAHIECGETHNVVTHAGYCETYTVFARVSCRETYKTAGVTVLLTACAVGGYYGYQMLLHGTAPAAFLPILRIFVKAMIGAAFTSYGYAFGCLFKATTFKVTAFTEKACAFGKWCAFLAGAVIFTINIFAVPYIQLMDFNHLDLGNPWVYLLLGTTGSVGCILICMSLPNIPIITFYGQNSLIVMCTHLNFYVLHVGMVISRSVLAPLTETSRLADAICSLSCTMILLIPVIVVIRGWFPFVLGRKGRR